MLRLTITEVLKNPDWHACSFDHKNMQIQFVKIKSSEINNVPFLDDRYLTNYQSEYITVSFTNLSTYLRQGNSIKPDGFIFHTAFCGSTLISRNMALIRGGCSIREPNILKELAILKRLQPEIIKTKMWKEVVWVCTQLLCRRYQPDGMTFIKPSNFDSNLIEDIMILYPDTKFLFLYSTMNAYIISNLKRGGFNLEFNEVMLKSLNIDSTFLSENKISLNDDIEPVNKMVLVWVMQVLNYSNIFKKFKLDNIAVLNFEDYLTNTEGALHRCYEFFGIKPEKIQSVIGNAINAKHSKDTSKEYDSEKKNEEDNRLKNKYGEQIDKALIWAKQFSCYENRETFLNLSLVSISKRK